MCVSPRSYAVRTTPRVRQQCIVKSPLLLSTLVLISLYIEQVFKMLPMQRTNKPRGDPKPLGRVHTEINWQRNGN